MSCGSPVCKSPVLIDTTELGIDSWSIPNPFEMAFRYQERWRQRQQLLELDDRLLADIGISRGRAISEARKPFWK